MNDKQELYARAILAAFFILIAIAAADVYQLSQVRAQYDKLIAGCPIYTGMRLNAPLDNYTGAVYIENGTALHPFDTFAACQELRRR